MENKRMSLEEECRYYNEQRERINAWKKLNMDKVEKATFIDYINSYNEQIDRLEASGAPEEVLNSLRAERTELGKRLIAIDKRIKTIERAKDSEENKNALAQSVLDRWIAESEEDRLDTETQFEMETGFLRRIQDRVIEWTGDMFGKIAAQIQIHKRARSMHDIEKIEERSKSIKDKMQSISDRGAKRLRFRRGVWAFRKALGHRVGIEPAVGYMSPTETEIYNQYSRELDDCIKEISAAKKQKEQAEKAIYDILRHRPDLMKEARYVLLDEELQEDATSWYQKFAEAEAKKTESRAEYLSEKEPGDEKKKDADEKEENIQEVPRDIIYKSRKAEDLSKRTITGYGRQNGFDYFIERGARRAPRAYIRIPEGSSIDALCELHDKPMDPDQRKGLTLPKEYKELFSSFVVNTSHKSLKSGFEEAQNEGRFAILEFRQKDADGKWKAFSDHAILNTVSNAIAACSKYDAEHTHDTLLAGVALSVVTDMARESCEMRDMDTFRFEAGAKEGKAGGKVEISFKENKISYFIDGKEAKEEDVAALIGSPRTFVKEMKKDIRKIDDEFWKAVRSIPEELPENVPKSAPMKDDGRTWKTILRDTQDIFYSDAFRDIDKEMKHISFELPSDEKASDARNCYGIAFNNKGYPVFTLNGTDVSKAEFEEAVEKGPGLSPFKEAFQTALSDKKEQLIELEKSKEREKNSKNKGRGE